MAVRIPTDPRQRQLFNQWITAANRPQGGASSIQAGPAQGSPEWVKALNPNQKVNWRNWIGTASGQIAPPRLPATELLSYDQRRQAANNNYLEGRANLDYQRGTTNRGFGDEVRNWQQGSVKQREALPTQFAQRGVLNSGIFRGALADQSQQSLQSYNDILRRRQAAQGGFSLQQSQMERSRSTQLQDIEQQKRARMMELALQLRGIGG